MVSNEPAEPVNVVYKPAESGNILSNEPVNIVSHEPGWPVNIVSNEPAEPVNMVSKEPAEQVNIVSNELAEPVNITSHEPSAIITMSMNKHHCGGSLYECISQHLSIIIANRYS